MTDPRIPPALEGATTALHRRIAELTAELEQKTVAVAEATALLGQPCPWCLCVRSTTQPAEPGHSAHAIQEGWADPEPEDARGKPPEPTLLERIEAICDRYRTDDNYSSIDAMVLIDRICRSARGAR